MFRLLKNVNYNHRSLVKKSYSDLKTHLTPQRDWIQPTGYDTGIKIYNCVTRDMVPLILPRQNVATWYSCGPTVYNSAHIGHASCYVKLDILQRILKSYFGINLVTAMNITDIDDKIIKRSRELEMDWRALSRMYEKEFWEEMAALDVEEPDFKIRVTENIQEIVAFIEKLVKDDLAYAVQDGSVYFEVEKYKNYGKLQRLSLEQNEKPASKKSSLDFALWKAAKSTEEPGFETPWSGGGRPGWHIECSVMATEIFGNQIDFHCGGLDLKFPHHENEEAQSCSFHRADQWVNYWIHTGHLHVQGDTDKMSKSLDNTIGIKEMLEMFPPEVFRVACILSNYRNSVEFGLTSMNNAEAVLKKILSFFADTNAYTNGSKPKVKFDSNRIYEKVSQTKVNVDLALRDDFDTAKVMTHLLDLSSFLLKIVNNPDTSSVEDITYTLSPAAVQVASNYVFMTLNQFGLNFTKDYRKDNSELVNIEEILESIVTLRSGIREAAISTKSKELFVVCDKIRDCLKENGIELKDHGKTSSTWNFVK